jgi:hypothetical protein
LDWGRSCVVDNNRRWCRTDPYSHADYLRELQDRGIARTHRYAFPWIDKLQQKAKDDLREGVAKAHKENISGNDITFRSEMEAVEAADRQQIASGSEELYLSTARLKCAAAQSSEDVKAVDASNKTPD